jgi:hypothetical protein
MSQLVTLHPPMASPAPAVPAPADRGPHLPIRRRAHCRGRTGDASGPLASDPARGVEMPLTESSDGPLTAGARASRPRSRRVGMRGSPTWVHGISRSRGLAPQGRARVAPDRVEDRRTAAKIGRRSRRMYDRFGITEHGFSHVSRPRDRRSGTGGTRHCWKGDRDGHRRFEGA